MPNWCKNFVDIEGDTEILMSLAEAVEQDMFCQAVIPVPIVLFCLDGAVPNKLKMETVNKRQELNNLLYGHRTANSFCRAMWNTKWDAEVDADTIEFSGENEEGISVLRFRFRTAWTPPTKVYEQLVDYGMKVKATYYEPLMDFAGVWENNTETYYEPSTEDRLFFTQNEDGIILNKHYSIMSDDDIESGDSHYYSSDDSDSDSNSNDDTSNYDSDDHTYRSEASTVNDIEI